MIVFLLTCPILLFDLDMIDFFQTRITLWLRMEANLPEETCRASDGNLSILYSIIDATSCYSYASSAYTLLASLYTCSGDQLHQHKIIADRYLV